MKLRTSMLLETLCDNADNIVERVLRVVPEQNCAYLIRINCRDALPEPRELSEMETGLSAGKIKALDIDPYSYLQLPEESIPEKHRRRRDAAWKFIEPIITAPSGAAFDPAERGKLIRRAMESAGTTKKKIYHSLRRYWQAGQTKNALLPYFHLCGGKGKEHKAGSEKRGRPRHLAKLGKGPAGINITPATRDLLRKGYRSFYEKRHAEGGRTKRMAYEQTLQKFFNNGYQLCNGVIVPVLAPASKLPSLKQFEYWGAKGIDLRESVIRRKGERKYLLQARPVLGDSTLMALGPGSIYQIDSTIADIWLVSGLDRSRRIGRPVLYMVLDVFSHLIAGFCVVLENPSFFAAGLALENAIEDKVSFCKKLGISIEPGDWPTQGLPESILADRGELEGYSADNLVNALSIQVSNTSPYRADCKGIVERSFRSVNDVLIHWQPGAVYKPHERGERDARLDAVLTLHEFRLLMVHYILQYNRSRLESYRLQTEMIANGVEPRPVDLWEWGIANRSGHLRQIDSAVVKVNLLPGAKATVTHRGIRCRKLYYCCDRAASERWYEKARTTHSWQVDVAYDPRLVDTIWLRSPGAGIIEPCQLVEADKRFLGNAWCDIENFYLGQAEAKSDSQTNDLQKRAEMQAQVTAIVSSAVEQATASNLGLTKRARLNGVKQNRKFEQKLDTETLAARPAAGNSGENGAEHITGKEDEAYVPPASPFELIRNERKAMWNENEK